MVTGNWEKLQPVTIYLYDIWGSSPNNVFAVGVVGTIQFNNGSKWENIISDTHNDLFGIWGSSSSNIFIVGENGIILHYDSTNGKQ
jgi:hypothetical protein